MYIHVSSMHLISSCIKLLRFSCVGLRSSSIRTFATLVTNVVCRIFTTDRDLSQYAFQPSKYSFTFLAYANFTIFY